MQKRSLFATKSSIVSSSCNFSFCKYMIFALSSSTSDWEKKKQLSFFWSISFDKVLVISFLSFTPAFSTSSNFLFNSLVSTSSSSIFPSWLHSFSFKTWTMSFWVFNCFFTLDLERWDSLLRQDKSLFLKVSRFL